MTSSSTQERAQEAASTAADEGRHVAGVAKDQAQNVASEAVDQARNVVSEATSQVRSQLEDQSRTQRDNAVSTLQTFGDDLQNMAEQANSGLAADIVRDVAQRAKSLGSAIDGREPQELLDDVRRFARRRPGVFLLGALAAGVVAGRVARGAKQAQSSDSSSTYDTSTSGISTPAVPPPPVMPASVPTATGTGDAGSTAPHGQPTVESATSTTHDPSSPMGQHAAGYGERGGLGEDLK